MELQRKPPENMTSEEGRHTYAVKHTLKKDSTTTFQDFLGWENSLSAGEQETFLCVNSFQQQQVPPSCKDCGSTHCDRRMRGRFLSGTHFTSGIALGDQLVLRSCIIG